MPPHRTTAEIASAISMEDVSTTTVLNAPALPPVPIYRGNTMADRRKFTCDYLACMMALNTFETQFNRPFAMPVLSLLNINCLETTRLEALRRCNDGVCMVKLLASSLDPPTQSWLTCD